MSGRGLNLSRGEEIGDDAIVDVQVLDVERIEVMGHVWVESSRKDCEPRVSSHEGYLQKKRVVW